MEEKTVPETQTVSFRDVRKSWAAAVTQLHVCELGVFCWIVDLFRTFRILSFCATCVSHVGHIPVTVVAQLFSGALPYQGSV